MMRQRRWWAPVAVVLLALHGSAAQADGQVDLQLSPDGSHLAYRSSGEGPGELLWVARTAQPADRQILVQWKSDVQSYRWSTASDAVAVERRNGPRFEIQVLGIARQPPWSCVGDAAAELLDYRLTDRLVVLQRTSGRLQLFGIGRDGVRTRLAEDLDARAALLDDAGSIAAVDDSGTWQIRARDRDLALPQVQDRRPLGASPETVLFLEAANDGDVLVGYDRRTGARRVLTAATSGLAVALDAEQRPLATANASAPDWQALDGGAARDVSLIAAYGLGSARRMTASSDHRIWLLDNPGADAAHRYALYQASEASVLWLFGPSGSAVQGLIGRREGPASDAHPTSWSPAAPVSHR